MMNSLQFRYSPNSTRPQFSRTFPPHYNFPPKFRFLSLPRFNGRIRRRRRRKQGFSICCSSKTGSQIEKSSIEKNDERPPFDINLAVILAGFAFEAYTTPPENLGRREVDAAGTKTIYLSEEFFREIYDGQLFIKLKKGSSFPAMDPWGTSDPYVVIQMGSQTSKSNIKWGTKEPTWNEEFTFNFKRSAMKPLQVAAWDANLVTPHKRMGNAVVDLEWLCDGDTHEILVELEGMGSGGEVWLEVAIWRDSARRRLVIAFRGTEQTQWKDLVTDLMLVPAGLNPERIGGDFKQEVQVHSGFLGAYDSVRTRIISLIRLAIGCVDDHSEFIHKWHIYVTGHSLGGALATLLALELSSHQLAKRGAISFTMYNFGSPRVGNKRFAEVYNEKVKDSWRIVNHRDIIPTIPRLMGYCHVNQPLFLAAGVSTNSLENKDILGDGYEGDVLGESTPDVIVNEFMKGEMELIEKLLQTEINIFRSIRDGSAYMQHMEDFYYITLLEGLVFSLFYQTNVKPVY